jgi:hypothetical protein
MGKNCVAIFLSLFVFSPLLFGSPASSAFVNSLGFYVRGGAAEQIFFSSNDNSLIDFRMAGFIATRQHSLNRFNCQKEAEREFTCRCDLPGHTIRSEKDLQEKMAGDVQLVGNQIIFEGELAQFLWEHGQPLELTGAIGVDATARFLGRSGKCERAAAATYRCTLDAF